jgi:hypothetical protein
MEALCRLLELTKSGPIPEGFEDPQASETEYSLDGNASELISNHPDLVIAEHWRDALQGSPEVVSSLPEIYTPNGAQLRDDFHQLPGLLSTSADDRHNVTQQFQLNSKSLYSTEPLSTSPIETPDPAPMSIEYHQSMEAPSIPQNFGHTGQSQCLDGGLYHHPKLVTSSARHCLSVYSNPKGQFRKTTDHCHVVRGSILPIPLGSATTTYKTLQKVPRLLAPLIPVRASRSAMTLACQNK